MITTTVTRQIEWDAAHRVLRHESKCATLHGHHYRALLTCEADELDDRDRVVDFGVLKQVVGTWVDDNWDHTTIVNKADVDLLAFCEHDAERGKRAPYVVDAEPTAEVIAAELFAIAAELLQRVDGLRVVRVVVYETPNCCATVESRRAAA